DAHPRDPGGARRPHTTGRPGDERERSLALPDRARARRRHRSGEPDARVHGRRCGARLRGLARPGGDAPHLRASRHAVLHRVHHPMSGTDTYRSPLAERYASRAMLALWSADRRYGLWRRLWLALAEAEQSLGVAIPDAALAQMRGHLDDIDYEVVSRYEKRFRHDVMAHVHAFGDVAPAARPFIHLGATSAFVTDNADLILMREGLGILRAKVVDILRTLAAFARQWRAE